MKSLLILFLLTCAFPFMADAQTIFVDITNNTGIEDGTEAHPFNTIKEGINAAVPGSRVMIKQGTYIPDESWSGNDHTLFLKAGVRLMGESRDNTIISGIVVDQQASCLSIGLEKLKFDEFHFARGTNAGPFNDTNIIRNCSTALISLPFGAGVPLNDTTPGPNYGFLIENNDLGTGGIIEFKQGAGGSELSATGNTCGSIYIKSGMGYTYLIDNNDVQYAIVDKSGTNTTTISNNRIYNGTIVDKSGGNQYGTEDEIIENNTITADESSPAFVDEDYKAGIIEMSRSATIRNNTITGTGHVSGIRSSAGAPLHIINNTITLDEVAQPPADPEEGTPGIFNYSGWGYVTGNKIHGGSHGYYSKAGTVEFANNEIEMSYTGFCSTGAEVVHHNIIKNCKGDGMILDGLKGPLHHNEVINNAGAGIRITRVPIDLGGGADSSQGLNTIKGNGNFDLYIETVNPQHTVVFARYNMWDHATSEEIMQNDIRDGSDSTGLPVVDFLPLGHLGINEPEQNIQLTASPNPFRGSSVIHWKSEAGCQAVLEISDSMGRKVKTLVDAEKRTGDRQVVFNASGLAAGVYSCRLKNGHEKGNTKLIVIK
jgi:hypothetical protein